MSRQNERSGIALSGDSYTVKQSLVRNKYAVYDDEGTLLLRVKQKLFRMKEQFSVTDTEGTPVFEVTAGNLLDIAGDYAVTDATTGEEIVTLEKKFTLFRHTWTVRDPEDDRVLATIQSSGIRQLLRNIPYLSLITSFIPHTYDITADDGRQVGTIEGKLSVRDTYEISITDADPVSRRALVIAAVSIDALEGN